MSESPYETAARLRAKYQTPDPSLKVIEDGVTEEHPLDERKAAFRNPYNPPYPVTPPKRSVYLAGPITGVAYGPARYGWRSKFAELMPPHIFCLSPMRMGIVGDLQPHDEVMEPGAEYTRGHILENAKGILTRDTFDVMEADIIVANFLGAGRVSIGTCAEFGMAHVLKKPVVLIMEPEGNPHHHGFITEIACYWVHSVEDAALVAEVLLTPGV